VQPLDVTGVRTMAVGALLWAVAFFVLLAFRGSLAEDGRSWWMWTCVAGFVIGVIGVEYCRRRRDRLSGQPAREPETSPLGAAGL
jgi:peptidoglycan/LPS O-acetylase OafA/YrhL